MTDKGEEIHPYVEKTILQLQGLTPEQLALKFIELKSKAHGDSLTGVMNEDGVLDVFSNIVDNLQKTESELQLTVEQKKDLGESHLIGFRGYGLWVVDLVGLHRTNEDPSLGWGEGDRKLKDVATGLQKVFRRSVDIIGRIGSDEFVVLSLNAKKDPDSAALILDKLRGALPADVQVNMVAGWYEKEVDPKTAISEAKEAITTAKRNGPLDETGRSLGYGLAKTGEYVQ